MQLMVKLSHGNEVETNNSDSLIDFFLLLTKLLCLGNKEIEKETLTKDVLKSQRGLSRYSTDNWCFYKGRN